MLRGGGGRIPDLRITSAPSPVHASIANRYDALSDCATELDDAQDTHAKRQK